MTAVTASVIQNACHTPSAPQKRPSSHAAGMMMTV